tara:strand:+ start:2410 stop:3141 length:732 start_codon:yes stop_codon:yes gene_type:complete
MKRKYSKGGKVPSQFKGFSSLPESVQRKINTSLAKKYKKGGLMSKGEYDNLVTKLKEEGGTLTDPSEKFETGMGIAGLAGSTIGALAEDNDATTYKAGEVVGDLAKGAASGATFGPIGAAVGAGAAVIGGLVNRNKAKKEEKKRVEEQKEKQQELTTQNINQNLEQKAKQEEEERVERSTQALSNMTPYTPMMRKYGGKVGMTPPPPGFMYDKNGNLIKTNRALDVREKGGLIAKKYSIGQTR